MGTTRLGISIATAVLFAGLATGCKKGRAATGPDQNTRPPPANGGGPGDHTPGRVHTLLKRPSIRIAAADAVRRKSALQLFDSSRLGLLRESPEAKKADAAVALEALNATIRAFPTSLETTFGPEGKELLREVEFTTPKCLQSACLVDVYYGSWRAFDGINQLLSVDQTLAWNKYTGTRYRSGREEVSRDPPRFVVTWALVFPLKSIDDELAEHPPQKGNGRAGRAGRKGVER